ncbi:MAG TPA: hypothetical protein VF281_00415 [Candidatus Saccharimonadales bacterium]
MQEKLEALLKIHGDHVALLYSISLLLVPFFASVILFFPRLLVELNVITLLLYAISSGLCLIIPSVFTALIVKAIKERDGEDDLGEKWALYTTMLLAMTNGIFWLLLSLVYFILGPSELSIKQYLLTGALLTLVVLPILTAFVYSKAISMTNSK